jgi:membrane-associated phospholipid phosphatase
MFLTDADAMPWWQLLTRLGEAQILLPAGALAVLALLRQAPSRSMAIRWLAALAVAAGLTTASKLAFIGWGLGWPGLNFTGVSGHAMFAAAVYPLLLGTLAPRRPRVLPVLALALGALLAGLIGLSRLAVQAHSVSEVVAGLALGAAVVAVALGQMHLPTLRISPWVPVTAAVWLFIMPAHAPPSQSHALVTRLALAVSGHPLPYTRADLHRKTPRPAGRPSV